jgi:hypothetical protein
VAGAGQDLRHDPAGRRHAADQVVPDECQALIQGDPEAFAEIVWGKRPVRDWVQVNLPAADPAEVRELLEDAWRRKAPKRVVAAYDAEQAI